MSEIVREGVRLSYREAGRGGPPMLFVHGFGGSSDHFEAQLEHFGKTRRVVALDRRGHGRSDKPEGPYDIPAIAEEVGWSADQLGLHEPVLVVHSMGAIGLELVRQRPDLASALVVIDAPALPPPPVRQAFADMLVGLKSEGYRQVIDAMCDRLIFLPTDDRARRDRLHAALLETPQRILAATWEKFLAYDPKPAAEACKLPLLYINAVMPLDEAGMRALCPQIQIGKIVGAGHFAQLEVAGQVNGMIDAFLEKTVERRAA
jgi:pimeloyl-ACP methyl ester carboxylesterase